MVKNKQLEIRNYELGIMNFTNFHLYELLTENINR
jgi:hypothetical protein